MEDFDINKLVLETLKPIGIPVYFSARKECDLPVLIFNIVGERGIEYWDDEEQLTKYKVTLNLFSKGNFIQYKKQILDLMKKAGFKRTDVPECYYHEDSEVYNQPLFFEIVIENI